jgi:hypothetical protein
MQNSWWEKVKIAVGLSTIGVDFMFHGKTDVNPLNTLKTEGFRRPCSRESI